MNWVHLSIIPTILLIIPFIFKYAGFIATLIVERLTKMESDLILKTTEPQVRQILSDKIDPIEMDLQEIKERINNILDHLIK